MRDSGDVLDWRRRSARPGARQALDRRRRRQGLPAARADRRRVRRRGADDLRPRPRPHRRHARQARVDPGLRHRPREPDAFRAAVRERGLRDRRPDRAARARRPPPVRDPRRHRHGRVDPADRRLDPVEEARRRPRRAGDGRQGRLRRVPARPRAARTSSRARSSRSPAATGCRPRRCSPTWTRCSAATAGNAVEVRESIDHLTGAARDERLHEVTLALSAELLVLGGVEPDAERARAAAEQALDVGRRRGALRARWSPRSAARRICSRRPDRHLPHGAGDASRPSRRRRARSSASTCARSASPSSAWAAAARREDDRSTTPSG